MGVAQGVFHSIKTKKMLAFIIKLDLSKAYDKVSRLYIRLLLIHVGLGLPMVCWIEGCLNLVLFLVPINGSTTSLFKPYRGFRLGCPLSSLLFLLANEGLIRYMMNSRKGGGLKGKTF